MQTIQKTKSSLCLLAVALRKSIAKSPPIIYPKSLLLPMPPYQKKEKKWNRLPPHVIAHLKPELMRRSEKGFLFSCQSQSVPWIRWLPARFSRSRTLASIRGLRKQRNVMGAKTRKRTIRLFSCSIEGYLRIVFSFFLNPRMDLLWFSTSAQDIHSLKRALFRISLRTNANPSLTHPPPQKDPQKNSAMEDRQPLSQQNADMSLRRENEPSP